MKNDEEDKLEPGRRKVISAVAAKPIAFALLLIGPKAWAQLAQEGAPLQYCATLFAQGNPRALALDLRLQYRHELGASGAAIGGFASVAAGPAGLRPGLGVEIQPLPFFSLGADYAATYYFGAFGLAQSYPSPRADYRSGTFSAPGDGPSGSYSLWAHQLTMHATLQGALGPILVRSTTRASRFFAALHANDQVFYDPIYDLAVDKDGWVGQNETEVAYPWAANFLVGLRHTLTITWYPGSAYEPGEPHDNPNSPISKLGPVAAWRFLEGERGLAQRGTLLLAAQWYLAHRYRTGEAVNGAIPYFGLALVFSGDLGQTR